MKVSNENVQKLLAGMKALGEEVALLEDEIPDTDLADLIEHFARTVQGRDSWIGMPFPDAAKVNRGLIAAEVLMTEMEVRAFRKLTGDLVAN